MKHRVLVPLLLTLLLSFTSAGLFDRSSAQTGAPENVRAWYSGRYIQLNWDLTDSGQFAGYNIYRATPEDWQWVKLNDSPHPFSGFVDFSPPEGSSAYYRIVAVSDNGIELNPGVEMEVELSAGVRYEAEQRSSLLVLPFDRNYILSDAEFTDANSMTLDEIQAFLASRGSVLARYESNGMTAAQHIYNAAQPHGINPRVILVMLQVQHGLITNSQLDLAKINSAMNWNPSDPTYQNFADQIFYGTQQLRDCYGNPSAYGLAINQPIEVADGTVTPTNAATAALYGYLPWIGEGGGGQKGVGGIYLFWDLATNNSFKLTVRLRQNKEVVAQIAESKHDFLQQPEETAVTATAVVDSNYLRFGHPFPGARETNPYSSRHTGIDYVLCDGCNFFSSGLGEINDRLDSNFQNYQPYRDATGRLVCDRYDTNYVYIKHLTNRGRIIYTKYLHLKQNSIPSILQRGSRIVKGQVGGKQGDVGCATASHLHFEMGTRPQAQLANNEKVIDPTTYANGTNEEINLVPFLSLNSSPNSSNYEVYGIANRPLYASITLTPATQKVFTNIGVGGESSNSSVLVFNRNSETFAANQTRTLTGSNTFPTPGDYRFFAHIERDQNGSIGSGYPLKVAILPNSNSKIVDNDSRTGYSANETEAQDVPGYFASAKLFPGGGANWARWSPNVSGRYQVFVHVPNGATARNVEYRISVDGQTQVTTDRIHHSDWNDNWAPLRAGSTDTWNFNANGYVYLVVSSIPQNQYVGVDAVKFIAVSGSLAPAATTGSASNVTSNSATLNGMVNPNGSSTMTHFQWGTSTSYGNTTSSQSIGSGTSNISVSADLSGLSPNTTYHYRVVASNNSGTSNGSNSSFTTSGGGCTGDLGESNDSFSAAHSLSCNASYQAKICSSTDKDYYRVVPSASGTLTVTMTPPSDKDYELYIYNASQQQICSSTRGTGAQESCSVSVTGGQTYYVRVIGYSGAFSITSDYGLGISCPTQPLTPQIDSISPTRIVGSTFDLAINGRDFDPNGAVDQIYKPDGQFLGQGTIRSRTATQIVVTERMAGAAPGNYTVRVRNPNGQLSNPRTLTLIAEVSVSPSSGSAGTQFSYQGRGFTGNFGVTSYLRKPDGSEFSPLQIPTDSAGQFSRTINSTGFAPGTYQVWAVDNNTGISSNVATFTVR